MNLEKASLPPERSAEAAGVLARAFLNDPFYRYVMPDPDGRPERIGWWMACLVRYGLRYGVIEVDCAPAAGAAIWLPPSQPMIDPLRMGSAGLVLAPFRLGLTAFRRLLEVDRVWDGLHRREPRPHWYLLAIGVDPDRQGQGIGGGLLRSGLARADAAGLPCYLETMTDRDVAFYRKHGFTVVAEGRIGNGSPFWTMRRPPVSH